MIRIFGHYVSVEMIVLCLVELLVILFVINMTLPAAGMGSGAVGISLAVSTYAPAILGLTMALIAVMIGLYRPEICLEGRRLAINAAVAGMLAFPVALLVSALLIVTINRGYIAWLAQVLVVWVIVMLATRWLFRMAISRKLFVRRVIVVGSGRRADRIGEIVRGAPNRTFDLVAVTADLADLPAARTAGFIPRDQRPERFARTTSEGALALSLLDHPAESADQAPDERLMTALREMRVWGVVVAADRVDDVPVRDLLHCKMLGIKVLSDVSFCERHLGRIELDHVDPAWFLFADGFTPSPVSSLGKRISDVTISLAILVLTLPLMLLTALLIRLDSSGPVFYRQQRIGLFGQPFTVMKFRSMSVDAEKGGRAVWAQQKDPRVTRVGGFIRSTRIDELPQLFNVLRGEMSFIGPRPERPHFVSQLMQVIPFYRERSYVKPGITGWAQVNFPYGASVEDARQKLSYDLYYVKNQSLFLDLTILVSTVRVILFQEGAR